MKGYNYLDDFLSLLKEDTKNFVFNDNTINNLINAIDEWMLIYDRLNTSLYNQYRSFSKTQKMSYVNKNKEYFDLSASKGAMLLNQKRRFIGTRTKEEVLAHFIKGYELIHRIRDVLTQQEITYSILHSGKAAKGKPTVLKEGHLTLSQILPAIRMKISSLKVVDPEKALSNMISLSITPSSGRSAIANSLSQSNNLLEQGLIANDIEQDLWDSLFNYGKTHVYKNINAGQVYEAYKILRNVQKYQTIRYIGHIPGDKNTEGLADALLKDAISNNDEGWKKGDVGLEQLKAIYKSSAEVMKASSIHDTLYDIRKSFLSLTQKDLTDSLVKIFTSSSRKFNLDVDQIATDEAIANIEAKIQQGGATRYKIDI